MTLELVVSDLANGGVPFAGVAVYVWHCDLDGGYSLYSHGITDPTAVPAGLPRDHRPDGGPGGPPR